jgi:hypothetical protein
VKRSVEDEWDCFTKRVTKPFIEDVLDGATEWRVYRKTARSELLAESFERHLFAQRTLGSFHTPALILNSTIVGHPADESDALNRTINPPESCDEAEQPFKLMSGGRLIFTNLKNTDAFPPRPSLIPDVRLPYQIVQDPNVRLASAAALNANFPPVYPNARIAVRNDKPDGCKYRSYYVTDGGAEENLGLISALYALESALAKIPKGVRVRPIHVVIAEASAVAYDYSQDRGFSAFVGGSPQRLAGGLTNDLEQTVVNRLTEVDANATIQFHYLGLPLAFRARGGFGTNWLYAKEFHLNDPGPRTTYGSTFCSNFCLFPHRAKAKPPSTGKTWKSYGWRYMIQTNCSATNHSQTTPRRCTNGCAGMAARTRATCTWRTGRSSSRTCGSIENHDPSQEPRIVTSAHGAKEISGASDWPAGEYKNRGATGLAASPSGFHPRVMLPDHDNFRAHLDPIGKINDILVGHPNAARRHGGADGVRLVRAMNAIQAGAKINRARSERIVHSASHMAGQVGPALEHLQRRRPIRPLALHRDSLRAGPGEALPANSDAIPERFAILEDIIEAALACRDDDCARLIAAVPSDDLTRDGLFPEKIKKIGQRPAVERIKVSQLDARERVIEGKSRRSVQEGEKDASAGKFADHCCPLVLPARERCTSRGAIPFKFCGQS